MAKGPEQIASGVYRVDAVSLSNTVSVLLIRDSDGWALVDTGMRGSSLRIQQALSALGAGPGGLKRIYVTHHHWDHIGGLPAVRWWAPEAEVVTSEHEARIISGEQGSDLPPNALLRFIARRQRLPKVPVNRVIREDDSFAGFRVIATPGHTQGHTSLLSDRYGLLFAGDAFGCLRSKIRVGLHKALCTDPAKAKDSAEKLLEEEFTMAVFSHGRLLRECAKLHLREAIVRCRYA